MGAAVNSKSQKILKIFFCVQNLKRNRKSCFSRSDLYSSFSFQDIAILIFCPMQCSYILNSVRFRTDSNSVRKTNLKKFYNIFRTELDSVRKEKNIFKPRKNSEPDSIRIGKKVAIFQKEEILNQIGIGSEKIALSQKNDSSAHILICLSDHSLNSSSSVSASESSTSAFLGIISINRYQVPIVRHYCCKSSFRS